MCKCVMIIQNEEYNINFINILTQKKSMDKLASIRVIKNYGKLIAPLNAREISIMT